MSLAKRDGRNGMEGRDAGRLLSRLQPVGLRLSALVVLPDRMSHFPFRPFK
jgi:hypothetical protein